MPASHPPVPQLPEPAGCFLFSDEIIKEITDEETKFGMYTAERCPPGKRDAIIELVAQDVYDVRWIARTVQVHQSTVTAVADRYAKEVADVRGVLARKFRRVVRQQTDRLERCPDMLPASSIPLTLKMLTEAAELLEGKATSRVEHVERVDIFADFPAFLASLEMDAKNEALGIGCEAKKSALIAGTAADPGPIIDVAADPVDAPGCNSKLQDSDAFPQANEGRATSKCYESGSGSPSPGQATTPPGGGSNSVGAGGQAIDKCTQNFWPNGSFEEPIEE